jgi:endonuclease/exonuclease/phosphatase family metal-dependent hydrolase
MVLLAVLLAGPLAAAAGGPLAVKAMSYNIRCASCDAAGTAQHWSQRRPLVLDRIRRHRPDVIAVQEAERPQLDELVAALGDYAWTGVGRDDGRDRGEFAAILYLDARFVLDAADTRWLSETPRQVSRGWDAALPRTLGIAVLRESRSGRRLRVFNTHFDHHGEQARLESSRLVLDEIEKGDASTPLLLLGDFNFTAEADGYAVLTSVLRDAEAVALAPPEGGTETLNGFGRFQGRGPKIDFVFVDAGARVLSHRIDAGDAPRGYASDHHPIIVEVEWP